MNNTKHYTYKQFGKKIFDNAYAIVNRHGIFHIYDEYEKGDGSSISILVESDDFTNGKIIELTNEITEGGVEYNFVTNEFVFTNEEDDLIGKFRVLIVGTMD